MRSWKFWIVSVAAVAPAVVAAETVASAASQPSAASASFVQGCLTMTAGSGCAFEFQFLDANGQPVQGVTVKASAQGVKGCTTQVQKDIPDAMVDSSLTTDANGMVEPALNCYNIRTGAPSDTGTVTLTVKGGGATASTTVTVT